MSEVKLASTTPILFFMVDDTDYRTPETGLTPTVTISKAGASFASPAGSVAEVGNGVYKLTPTAADTDTLGPLSLHATATGAYCHPPTVDIVANLESDTYTAVSNITSGSAAINVTAGAFTKTTGGTETNTYTSTQTPDGTYHIVPPSAGNTELFYEFDVGANGVPVSVTWVGYAQSNGDSYAVRAYNWGTTSWDQIGTINAANGTTQVSEVFDLLSAHVGTGANEGLVRWGVESSDGTNFATDRLLCSYAVVYQSAGYSDGAIWIDTNASNTNTEPYVDGVADNPVSTWAAALTLSASLGLTRFQMVNGSAITLTADSSNYTLKGFNWTLALNGQNIAGMSVYGATITGTGTGSGWEAIHCFLGNGSSLTVAPGVARQCAIAGDLSLSTAGTYYFEGCFSGIAGTATPSLDFGAAVGDTNVNFRHYSGGIEIENMGTTGTDTMSLEGFGQYIINANCAVGSLAVRGNFTKTDNTNGDITISQDANYQSSTIHSGHAQVATTNTITLSSFASATDGAYDPAAIFIVAGQGAGQSRLIYQYNGTTKVAVVDRDWKVIPNLTSEYRIVAHPGREHVNEGLAQAGAASTITLNALASSVDDAYKSQLVLLRSGTGADQVRLITAYNGTTKIATVEEPWSVVPDSTSGYVMLPSHVHSTDEITPSIPSVDDINTKLVAEHGDGSWKTSTESTAESVAASIANATPDEVALGETYEISVTATDADGNPVTIDGTWSVAYRFTRNRVDGTPIVSGDMAISAGAASAAIDTGTKEWDPGTYWWDARLTDPSGNKHWSTPIEVRVRPRNTPAS